MLSAKVFLVKAKCLIVGLLWNWLEESASLVAVKSEFVSHSCSKQRTTVLLEFDLLAEMLRICFVLTFYQSVDCIRLNPSLEVPCTDDLCETAVRGQGFTSS
jgi:hypothetical protein